MDRRVIPGGLYRHYKDRWYFVIDESKDSESETCYVTYFPLYLDELKLFVREKTMFLEDVDNDNDLGQKERFLESGRVDLPLDEKKDLLKKADHLLKTIGLKIMGE